MSMSYSVYFLKDEFNNLYIGQSHILETREKQQINKTKKAAKFVKENGNFKLVYKEDYSTRLESMRREKQVKGWTRAKKEALISGDLELLNKL